MPGRLENVDSATIELNEEDIANLMNLLRNANHPLTTQELVDALRRQSGQGSASSQTSHLPTGRTA